MRERENMKMWLYEENAEGIINSVMWKSRCHGRAETDAPVRKAMLRQLPERM